MSTFLDSLLMPLELFSLLDHLMFVLPSLAFLTEVDSSSHPVIMELIGKHVVGTKEAARIIKQPILQQEQNSIQVLQY